MIFKDILTDVELRALSKLSKVDFFYIFSLVSSKKHTFCDFEAHRSIPGYIYLTHTHKHFQVIQFMNLLTQKHEIHDIN